MLEPLPGGAPAAPAAPAAGARDAERLSMRPVSCVADAHSPCKGVYVGVGEYSVLVDRKLVTSHQRALDAHTLLHTTPTPFRMSPIDLTTSCGPHHITSHC
jgi:hypothetical protein